MRKMDEMELHIQDVAIRWSWMFSIVALFIWGVVLFVKTKEMSLPMILFFLQMVVYFGVGLIEKAKVGEDGEGRKLFVYFALLLVFVLFFGAFLHFYL